MRRPRPGLILPLLMAAPIAATLAASPGGDVSPVESSRATLARWVETQQLIAKEKRDWQEGKQILAGRIDLVKGEIAALETQMKEERQSGSGNVVKQTELTNENSELEQAGRVLRDAATDLEGRLQTLLPQLPEPLRDKVAPLYGRMPKDPASTTVSVAERFQNVVGILNEVNKFNGEVTMVNEVRTLSSGKPAEVRTIYAGLGQAWYLSAGGEAGVGRPGPEGWTWEPANDLAPSIGRAVEILQSKSKPAFVPLPVKVR
ncbi:MAG TPA: DUF3450 family protein [Candidatus Polarisedimenticolia bacterium]|nr:DUF3450 family protein [Candidatus Polarisedimenticolia bacterium]